MPALRDLKLTKKNRHIYSAALLLATFVSKDVVKERQSDSAHSIDSARTVYAIRSELLRLRRYLGQSPIQAGGPVQDANERMIRSLRSFDDDYRPIKEDLEVGDELAEKVADRVLTTDGKQVKEKLLELNTRVRKLSDKWFGIPEQAKGEPPIPVIASAGTNISFKEAQATLFKMYDELENLDDEHTKYLARLTDAADKRRKAGESHAQKATFIIYVLFIVGWFLGTNKEG